jgi:hypothetical protein
MCDVVLLPLASGGFLWVRPDSRDSSLLFVLFVLAFSGSVLTVGLRYAHTRRDRWRQGGSLIDISSQPPTLRMASILKLIFVTLCLCRTLRRSLALAMHNSIHIILSSTRHRI